MQQIETIKAMRAASKKMCAEGKTIALVPTLGALHAGHVALMRRAAQEADVVVVSVFVNPLQFGTNEDLGKYPRSLAADVGLAGKEGAAAVFTPSVKEMYPKGYSTFVTEDRVSKPLCGMSRPALFRGVLTGWLKLINIVQPDVLAMGEKDPQQIAVLRKALADLSLDVRIVSGPFVRDPDGLALNARNDFITPKQRAEALSVHRALVLAEGMVASGVKNADRIVAEATHVLGEKRRLRVIYIALVNRETMEPMREVVPGKSLLAIAYWVEDVRLTDSCLF